jgi:hypothetical protein
MLSAATEDRLACRERDRQSKSQRRPFNKAARARFIDSPADATSRLSSTPSNPTGTPAPRFQVRPAAPQPNLAAFLLNSVPGRRTHTTEARPASIKIIQFPNTRSGIHPADLPLFFLLKLWPICLARILNLFSTRRRGLLVGPSTCGAKPLQTSMTPPLLQLSLSRSRPLSSDCASIREQNSAWCSLPGDHDGPDGMQTLRCRLSQGSQGARRDTRQTKEEAGAQPESVKGYLLTTICSLQWHLRLCQLPGGKGPKVHR